MKEPEFLELEDVLDLHERQLADFGAHRASAVRRRKYEEG